MFKKKVKYPLFFFVIKSMRTFRLDLTFISFNLFSISTVLPFCIFRFVLGVQTYMSLLHAKRFFRKQITSIIFIFSYFLHLHFVCLFTVGNMFVHVIIDLILSLHSVLDLCVCKFIVVSPFLSRVLNNYGYSLE